MNFKSIKDPVDFQNFKEARKPFVVQNLKDIRTAQLAYKTSNGAYADNFDTLLTFIKMDSIVQVKSSGNIPDGMNEKEAIDGGYYKKETTKVPAQKVIFSDEYLATREKGVGFSIDSLKYIPFSTEVYDIASSKIERNGVKVPVFEVVTKNDVLYRNWEKRFYSNEKQWAIGSMVDPSTAGNWE